MRLDTKYFGEMEYDKEEIITFQEGLFGFENEKEYLLIRFDNEADTLLSLQSVNTPQLAFIVVNPFRLMNDYDPYVSDKDLEMLGVNNQELVAIYAIAVVGDDITETTINLKAPLVMNPENHQARQVILDSPEFSFRHKFVAKEQ
jgi:flagellar assembly factor FliW